MTKRKTTPPRKPIRKKRTQRNYLRVTGRNWRTGKVSAQMPTWVVVAAILLFVILFTPPDVRASLSAALFHLFDWLAKPTP